MADDKRDRGTRDRATVSSEETYELDYFAQKHGLSYDDAQALIDQVGNGRTALEAAVAKKPGRPRLKTPPRQPKTRANVVNHRPRRTQATTKKPRLAPRESRTKKLASVAEPLKTIVSGAGGVVAKPVGRAVAPVAKQAGASTQKVKAVVRKGTTSLRDAAKNTPKGVMQGASAAVDGATSAVTSRAAGLIGAAAVGLVAGLAANLGRKIMVQAPSAFAGDWFDAVKAEHKLALALFDQLEATSSDQRSKRSGLLIQLKHALSKHAFMEENVLYPGLRAWGDKADADKLNHDHGYIKQNLYDLEEMDNSAPSFLEKVAMFRAEIEAHIREEEDAIFPPLHAALGEAGNAKLTAQANKEGFKLA